MWWTSLINAGFGLFSNLLQNRFNSKYTDEVNRANRDLVASQNAAAASESEKSYGRSKPIQQIADMRNAGLSEAAAAQRISGGATYQPAPVQVSHDQANNIDLSQSVQAIQSAMAMAQEQKLAKMQLAAQAKENAANRANAKEIAQINASAGNANAQLQREIFEHNKSVIAEQVKKLQNENELLKANLAGVNLDNARKELENKNLPTIQSLLNEEKQQMINKWILDYQHAVENHSLDKRSKEIANEIAESGIDVAKLRDELDKLYLDVQLEQDSAFGGFGAKLEIFLDKVAPLLGLLGKM